MPKKKKSPDPNKIVTDNEAIQEKRRQTLRVVNETRTNLIGIRAAIKTHSAKSISLGQSIQGCLDTLRIYHDELTLGDGPHFHTP